jgi:hypothetical protein
MVCILARGPRNYDEDMRGPIKNSREIPRAGLPVLSVAAGSGKPGGAVASRAAGRVATTKRCLRFMRRFSVVRILSARHRRSRALLKTQPTEITHRAALPHPTI